MSALSRPICGRASDELETFTAIAGRLIGSPGSAGSPVSGQYLDGTVVVVTAVVVGGGSSSPPRVTTNSRTAQDRDGRAEGDERLSLRDPRACCSGPRAHAARRCAPRAVDGCRRGGSASRTGPLPSSGPSAARSRGGRWPGSPSATTVWSSRSFSRADTMPGRVPGDLHGGEVGQRLPAAADRQLHELGDDRRQDQERPGPRIDQRSPPPELSSPAPAPAAEPQGPDADVGQQGDGADHRHGQCGHEDVVVLDVAELVGQHRLELDAVHLLEQAGRDGDGGVLRVPPGGEGVGGVVLDDVEAGLGQAGGDAQALDDVVEPGVLLDRRRAGPGSCAGRSRRTSSSCRWPGRPRRPRR